MRTLTATALLLALLVLAGCSSAGKTQGSSAGHNVDLTLMTWGGMSTEATQALAEAYSKQHPGVHVTLKDANLAQLLAKGGNDANTAVFDGIDVALLPGPLAAGLQRSGKLRDLSGLRLPALNDALAPLIDDLGSSGGKRWGVPFSVTPSMLIMNEQAFTQAGVKAPPLDWTVQDFEQATAALKAAGAPLSLPADAVLDPILHAYGGQAYDSNKQAWTLDTPEARQGLAAVARLVKQQVLQVDTGGPIQIGGKNGPALLALPGNVLFKGVGPTGTMQPLPRGPKGRGTPLSAAYAVVGAGSAHADVAADFVRSLLADPAAQLALARSGIRPVTADAAATAAWRESVGERTAQATDLALQGAYVEPVINVARVVQGLTSYFSGSASLDQVLPGLLTTLQS